MTPRECLTRKETQIAILVWEGLTNREISKIVGTTEQVIKNHLRSAFDKLGVWSRLELAMYVASHGGKNWPEGEIGGDSDDVAVSQVAAAATGRSGSAIFR
jgi:DNA-binding CsgD family transcriptional regulator